MQSCGISSCDTNFNNYIFGFFWNKNAMVQEFTPQTEMLNNA